VGLLGLGAVLSLRRANQTQNEVVQATPVLVQATITPSPTITPIPPTPTNTPEPTATGTLVVGPTPQEAAAGQPTLASLFGTPTADPNVTPTETPTTDPNITPTNTLVLRTPEAGTSTPAAVAVNPPAQIPQGGGVLPGDDKFLIGAGLGVLLLLIFGLINYLRSPTSLSGR
jgi:hypothetical protein